MNLRREIIRTARKVAGEFTVPADKSITHRALILGSLAEGSSRVANPLRAADTLSTLNGLRMLGVTIKEEARGWTVQGRGLWGYTDPGADLPCGNSGTTMRLLSGVLAAQEFSAHLVGDSSLTRRPMKRIVEPLNLMGAQISAREGEYPPLVVRGRRPLRSLHWRSPVASAQVKSCLLLASLHAEGTTVYEEPVLSRDHTERMLVASGVLLKRLAHGVEIQGPQSLQAHDWEVPGDPSSAAYFVAATALLPGSEICVHDISVNETRIGFFRVLQRMGAEVIVTESKISGRESEPMGNLVVRGGRSLKGITIGSHEVVGLIDEVPLLAVVATQALGQSVITGAAELRVKESDRLKALALELRKMGARIEELPDGLAVEGETPLVGNRVDSHGDHRLAMALAVAGLVARGETCVLGAECVDISFPDFWDRLGQMVC